MLRLCSQFQNGGICYNKRLLHNSSESVFKIIVLEDMFIYDLRRILGADLDIFQRDCGLSSQGGTQNGKR